MKNSTQNGYIDQYIRFIVQNGYIAQYIRFVHYFSPMYNVSTWVVIRIYWKIYVPRASGPLDYIFQYIRITTHVLYQYNDRS